MGHYIKLAITAFFIFCIGWFITFQFNPYRVCKDHPDPALRKDYYLCEPGGFELQKGTRMERAPEEQFPWEKHGDTLIGEPSRQKRQQYVDPPEDIACNPDIKYENPQMWKEYMAKICRKQRNQPPSLKNDSIDNLPDLGTHNL